VSTLENTVRDYPTARRFGVAAVLKPFSVVYLKLGVSGRVGAVLCRRCGEDLHFWLLDLTIPRPGSYHLPRPYDGWSPFQEVTRTYEEVGALVAALAALPCLGYAQAFRSPVGQETYVR